MSAQLEAGALQRPRSFSPSSIALQAFLVIMGILFVLPFVWMLSTSLKPPRDIFQVTLNLIPSELRWENYGLVLDRAPFVRFYLNSGLVALGRVLGQIVLCSMAAFAFARLRFPGREPLFLLLLAALMVPEPMIYIPNFVLLRELQWLDTYQGIVVPTLVSAFGTFLLRQFFMTIPQDYQEAAVLEGANPFQVYWHIFLPLAKSALAAFALFQVVWSWKDFLWPLIVASRTEMYVLPVGIALLKGDYPGGTPDVAPMMAAAAMATVPMLVVFVFVQRQLIEGISLSGVKG